MATTLSSSTRRVAKVRVGVGAVVVCDELQLLAVHAALGVDVVDVNFERLFLGITQE
jgi:hypothetical protein